MIDVFTFAKVSGYNLNPIKTIMLKMFYGVKLDEKFKNIDIVNQIGTSNVESNLSEAEIQNWLYENKRTNKKANEIREHTNLYLELKRRSGKTMLSELILKYEIEKMNKRNGTFLRLTNSIGEVASNLKTKNDNITIVWKSYGEMRNYFNNYNFVLFENFSHESFNRLQINNTLRYIRNEGKFLITDDCGLPNQLKEELLNKENTLHYKAYSTLCNPFINNKYFNKNLMFQYKEFTDNCHPKTFVWNNEFLN